ncbi:MULTISPECIES: endonuclease/exonuclease/phosphatase family protein [Paenibacillus]|uniref:endonuclease/exonuclease/phosphatase family protein n=1 Tax=Paenibacillus TaxID=44249 RepID=UPI00038566E4|nr:MULTISPECIES: endonuclease/exonuclease/phosphatase family protein [Paenibacillus]EPY10132.1 endonuclease/exonuclease/phosphatase family protein [Paenibacillus alvei A6-6i-x]SDF01605.1 Exonuclease III [Paenibacillus sp. cl6col]
MRNRRDTFVQEMESGRNLKVMTFNIWRGSTSIVQVAEAIRTAEADVIGIQEADGQLPALARKLNFYYDEGHSILSRYPLHQSAHKEFIWVEVAPDEVAAMSNVHLCHEPYGPYDIRDGLNAAAAVANENRIHMQEMNSRFHLLGQLASQGVPVFLTGDFNAPSHLDWTDEAKSMHFGVAVEWSVSIRLEQLQFRDSYREVHSDPLTKPAVTWTPGGNGHIEPDEVHDRIDFVYAGGPSATIDSCIVGERGPYTDIAITPWPSDHRAVVSTFELIPARISMDLGSSIQVSHERIVQGKGTIEASRNIE